MEEVSEYTSKVSKLQGQLHKIQEAGEAIKKEELYIALTQIERKLS